MKRNFKIQVFKWNNICKKISYKNINKINFLVLIINKSYAIIFFKLIIKTGYFLIKVIFKKMIFYKYLFLKLSKKLI